MEIQTRYIMTLDDFLSMSGSPKKRNIITLNEFLSLSPKKMSRTRQLHNKQLFTKSKPLNPSAPKIENKYKSKHLNPFAKSFVPRESTIPKIENKYESKYLNPFAKPFISMESILPKIENKYDAVRLIRMCDNICDNSDCYYYHSQTNVTIDRKKENCCHTCVWKMEMDEALKYMLDQE